MSSPDSDSSPYVFYDDIVPNLEQKMKEKLTNLEQKMKEKLTNLEQKMEGHEKKLTDLGGTMNKKLTDLGGTMNKKLTNLKQIMEGHEKRLTGLEGNVSSSYTSRYSSSGSENPLQESPTQIANSFFKLNTRPRGGKLTRNKLLKKSKRKTKKHQ